MLLPLVGPASAAPSAAAPADGTPSGAIEWFQQQSGDTSYEGLCEMAVENAYGTTGVWPSARAHWEGARSAGKAHEGDTDPPEGAFVYWDTSENGHVGIADGSGGFYSSSVGGAIGHAESLSYFGGYLGWSEPQVPA
nr:CHAP domain-containing protein [Saccharopolyspora sp. HNM0983]